MFNHLKTRDVAGKKKWLSVPQVRPNARLLLLPATDVNKNYNAASLKLAGARASMAASTGRQERDDRDASRRDDRKLYAEYIVKDWDGIVDDQGNEVPFSREVALEFFEVLPAWIFDRIRLFCVVPENFLDEGEATIDTEALTGNSESDSSGS